MQRCTQKTIDAQNIFRTQYAGVTKACRVMGWLAEEDEIRGKDIMTFVTRKDTDGSACDDWLLRSELAMKLSDILQRVTSI